MIKNIKLLVFIGTVLLSTGCDKDFEEINKNPYAVNAVDPALLFAGSQRTHLGTWNGEHTIIQHFVQPYNTGANLGFNFNEDIDGFSTPSEYVLDIILREQERLGQQQRVESHLLEGLDSGKSVEVTDDWWNSKRADLDALHRS